jgi:hypothetical protein
LDTTDTAQKKAETMTKPTKAELAAEVSRLQVLTEALADALRGVNQVNDSIVQHSHRVIEERDQYDQRRREAMASAEAWRAKYFQLEQDFADEKVRYAAERGMRVGDWYYGVICGYNYRMSADDVLEILTWGESAAIDLREGIVALVKRKPASFSAVGDVRRALNAQKKQGE